MIGELASLTSLVWTARLKELRLRSAIGLDCTKLMAGRFLCCSFSPVDSVTNLIVDQGYSKLASFPVAISISSDRTAWLLWGWDVCDGSEHSVSQCVVKSDWGWLEWLDYSHLKLKLALLTLEALDLVRKRKTWGLQIADCVLLVWLCEWWITAVGIKIWMLFWQKVVKSATALLFSAGTTPVTSYKLQIQWSDWDRNWNRSWMDNYCHSIVRTRSLGTRVIIF